MQVVGTDAQYAERRVKCCCLPGLVRAGIFSGIQRFRLPKGPTTEDPTPGEPESTQPVEDLAVSSRSLPLSVAKEAAERTGLLHQPFRLDRAEACARDLNGWLRSEGYILSKVRPISAPGSDGLIKLDVLERSLGENPVKLHFFEFQGSYVLGDNFTAADAQQYMQDHGGFLVPNALPDGNVSVAIYNPTATPRLMRTHPSTLSSALGLIKGKPFRWSPQGFNRAQDTRLFRELRVASIQENRVTGDVEVHLNVSERPSILFQPGFSVSLGDKSVVGDVELKDTNLFGRNFQCSLHARMHPNVILPDLRASFENNRFGRVGGFSLELFQKTDGASTSALSHLHGTAGSSPGGDSVPPETLPSTSEAGASQTGPRLCRRGWRSRVSLPTHPFWTSSIGTVVEKLKLTGLDVPCTATAAPLSAGQVKSPASDAAATAVDTASLLDLGNLGGDDRTELNSAFTADSFLRFNSATADRSLRTAVVTGVRQKPGLHLHPYYSVLGALSHSSQRTMRRFIGRARGGNVVIYCLRMPHLSAPCLCSCPGLVLVFPGLPPRWSAVSRVHVCLSPTSNRGNRCQAWCKHGTHRDTSDRAWP